MRDALSAILASPQLPLSRGIRDTAGGLGTLSDLELASRLSFFLWSSVPDDELLKLAERVAPPASRDVLAAQVSRMLADPRAKSLVDDFAFQWLGLAKLDDDRAGPRASSRRRAACSIRATCSRRSCGSSSTACCAAIRA